MNKLYLKIVVLFAVMGLSQVSQAQVIVFSETFINATPPSATICANWNTFRASLTALPFVKMRFTGSLSSTVFECTNPVIIADIALKIRTMPGPVTANAFSWVDGANTWQLGTDVGGRFGVNTTSLSSCDNPGHLMKPCIPSNANWGGFGTLSCGGPTQTITLEFFYGTPMNNASASAITSPVGFCAGTQNIVLKVKNTGYNVLNNVQVDWTLNGMPQSSIFYNTPIDTLGSLSGNEALVALGSANITAPVTLKAWTLWPNGVADTANYDDTVNITLQPSIQGTFTIGGPAPDYATFAAAATALGTYGVCGPVIFNVFPGIYPEQLSLPVIPTASASNTITFNGTGVTLQATPVSATRALVKLDGTDYVTINGLTLTSLSATYGWGVHLLNGADHNTITNCTINLNATTSTTQSNSGGIVMSGSTTSVVTAGSANYNTISNNVIMGGYQGVIVYGAATSINAKGNVVTGNDIQDYYGNGVMLSNTDSIVLSNNIIHRPIRNVTLATNSGIDIGAGCRRSIINANKIYDTHLLTSIQTGTAYGIFSNSSEAPAGFENLITNNLIYNLGSNTGTTYGIYNSTAGGNKYYHNTVVLDKQASTAGVTRGFYQTGAIVNTIELKNNILYVNRPGTGVKHNIYLNTANNIISNNNDLVMLSPAGTNYTGYHNAINYASLVNWQTANSNGYDQASTSLDPAFTNSAGGDFTPANTSLNNQGTPVGVLADVLGQVRSAVLPDLGAYEFLAYPLSGPHIQVTAVLKENDALIEWNMDEEKNIDRYLVQRSRAGQVFDDIAEVTVKNKDYFFTDKDVVGKFSSGKLHYRIKMRERNGKDSYSMIYSISLDDHTGAIAVYPNPFTEKIGLYTSVAEEGNASIRIYDMNGRLMLRQARYMNKGSNVHEITELAYLAKGVYQLVFELNGNRQNIRIIK